MNIVTATGFAVFDGETVIAQAQTHEQAQRIAAALNDIVTLREALGFAVRFFDQLTPADATRMRLVLEKSGGTA